MKLKKKNQCFRCNERFVDYYQVKTLEIKK